MDCEVILSADVSQRATKTLKAMIEAAPKLGIKMYVNEKWRRQSNWLMSYGLGHPIRRKWTEAHVANGGRLIGWDLGYWDRDNAMRVTVDNLHPWRLITDMPKGRWEQANIALREDADPEGPILLVGMGRKSRAQFAMQDRAWEREALKAIRMVYPDRKIHYRPKVPEDAIPGTVSVGGCPIQEAIQGCSLVVCRHSNVAVDACIAGVPVVCEDGAARAIYRPELAMPINPTAQTRLRFLQNLAWWQWTPNEAIQTWKFLTKILDSTSAAASAH